MKKTVTIKIEIDMKSEQCDEWGKPSDYFEESVKEALDKIHSGSIKNYSDEIETDSEKASFTVRVQTGA